MQNPLYFLLAPDQADLITCMLLCIVISFFLPLFTNRYMLIISIVMSASIQLFMFPTEVIFLWAQQQIVYVLLCCVPRQWVGWVVFGESSVLLGLVQVRRMWISFGENGVDITGILMMQYFLYVSLGWNYRNGGKAMEELSEDEKRRCILKLPSYFTYLGYVFFLPACLVGPVFQFRDFQDYVNGVGDYQSIPSRLAPMLFEARTFLICLVCYFLTDPFEILYTTTEEFAAGSYLYKMLFIGGVILHIELKYITAWSLGMIGMHASGITYNQDTKQFDKINTTKIVPFFFDPSLKIKAECWNMSVQVCLRRYIYENIYRPHLKYSSQKIRKKVQLKAQLCTILTSAFWHGLYPGYYISFVHWFLYLRINQELYKVRNKYPSVDGSWKKFKVGILENLVGNYVFWYFGMFFHLMTWQRIKAVMFTTYFIPFFFLYIAYLLVVKVKVFVPAKVKT